MYSIFGGATLMFKQKVLAFILSTSTLVAADQLPALAQISDDVVKIGVLTDMSSVYSDATGKGSVTAAQMASEISVGASEGSLSKLSVAIIRISRTSVRPLHARGTTPIKSMSS
jgi:hypothetical protein